VSCVRGVEGWDSVGGETGEVARAWLRGLEWKGQQAVLVEVPRAGLRERPG